MIAQEYDELSEVVSEYDVIPPLSDSCLDILNNYEFSMFAFSAYKNNFQKKMKLSAYSDDMPTHPKILCQMIKDTIVRNQARSSSFIAKQALLAADEIVEAFKGNVTIIDKKNTKIPITYQFHSATLLRLFIKQLAATTSMSAEQLKNSIIEKVKKIQADYKIGKNKAAALKLYFELYPEHQDFKFNGNLNKCMLKERNKNASLIDMTAACGLRNVYSPPNIWWAEEEMNLNNTPSEW